MRITALATLTVAAAIGIFSIGVVGALGNSLVGEVRQEVVADVEEAVAGGADAAADEGGVEVPDAPADASDPAALLAAARAALGEGRGRVEFVFGEELVVAERVEGPDGGDRIVVASGSTSDVDRATRRLAIVLLWAAPLLLGAVAAVTWHATGRALAPIESLRTEAETISHSTLERRLPAPPSGDEVGALAATLNRMLARIDAAVRRQREFVSDAAHELRTPIAAVRTELEVAVAHPGRADWLAVARSVAVENHRLAALVDDLLLLAQLDETPSGAHEPVELGAIVDEQLARTWPVPVRRRGGDATVEGDPALLDRVVSNLLDNATRHARSLVEVGIEADAVRVVMEVADDGPGIPPDERERVFERFTRSDTGRSRPAGGAGLGLALVRGIVETHRGRVVAGRAALGGAVVTVTLPRADATDPGGAERSPSHVADRRPIGR